VARALHLFRRFVGSLRPGGPPATEVAWVQGQLLSGEAALWAAMPGPDRRHSAAVARRVVADLGDEAARPVVAAALLHDVGKTTVGLRTPGRVLATLVAGVVGHERASAGAGRIGRYLHHDQLGAERLAEVGSDPLTVAWAREHHRPPATWTVPRHIADALKAADDD
jgi:hypothetical protein